jgi:hypothetical protein
MAVKNATKTQIENNDIKTLNTEMNKELKVFKKDSVALAAVRIQLSALSLDLGQAKEKEEKLVTDMKDCIHRFKKAEKSL